MQQQQPPLPPSNPYGNTDASSGILTDLTQAYLTHLTASLVLETGFEACDASALAELVAQAVQFLGNLCSETKLRANAGRRSNVSSMDVLDACTEAGLDARTLAAFQARQRLEYPNPGFEETALLDLPVDAPLVLPADQQQANEEMLSRLPIQPDHLPFLPPPHLYKTTPVRFLIRCLKRQLQANHREKVYEEKENNTEVRVRETRLVESSLRNLIRATTSAAASSTSRRSTQQQDSQQQASTSTATAGDDAPAVTTDTATTPAPEDKENVDDLISLDLLARSNMDDTLDASVVNWKSGRAVQSLAPRLAYATAVANSRKRASQAGGDPGAGSGPEREGAGGARAKKIRWRLAA